MMTQFTRDTRVRNVSVFLLVSTIFGILAWGGVALTRDDGRIAVVWLANAFLVAVILRAQTHHVPYYLAGSFVANIATNLSIGDTLLHASVLAGINQFEMILIWLLLQRCGLGRPNMQKLSELVTFCFIGGLLAPLISGLLASLFLAAGSWDSLPMLWLQWSSTDGLGVVLLSPAVMVVIDLIQRRPQSGGQKTLLLVNKNRWEWLAIQLVTLATTITIFGILGFPAFYVIAPLVLLSAFRLGTPGTSVSIVIIAIVVVFCAAFETGPFYAVDLSLTAKLFTLQFFLLSCFAVGMPTSAMLAEKAQIRRTLRMHREVSSSMLENMNEVVFRTDDQFRWQFLNPAWKRLTGRTVQDSLGCCVTEIFDARGLDILEPRLATIRNGAVDRSRFEASIEHCNGSRLDVELSFSPLPSANGSFAGIVGSIRDVTERRQMEQKLVAAREGAEKAADAKTRFLASMSHEIRTPMNGVLGFAQLLLESDLDEEQKNHTRIILDSGNAMMRLLNNILDIAKVEAGQTSCAVEPMSVHDLLRNCMDLMGPAADKKRLDLDLEIDTTVPPEVLADVGHLRQIMLNLLGNAVKFTSGGAVRVIARAEPLGNGEINLHLVVEDTGIGIAPNRLEAIFAPFEQAEANTSRKFGGSGLGLTISRQLLSVMKGTIDVNSVDGKGTSFHIRLPARLPASDRDVSASTRIPPPVDAGEKHQPPSVKTPSGKILLAEDHDINQILIVEMIERLGYQAVLAVNGRDAVEKVDEAARDESPFDLVLMDVQMPEMDGYEATQTIRRNGYCEKQLPILAITANAYPEDIENCLRAGMQGHIPKPVMIDTIRSSMKDWIAVA